MGRDRTQFRRRLAALGLAGIGLAAGVPVMVASVGQDNRTYEALSDAEQKDWLVQFVEGQLSTPERQIHISNLDGLLGSDVSAREIAISDQEGVWLRILNARLNWNQAALFLGRLEVRSLAADSIAFIRQPSPAEDAPVALPSPEASGFAVPEFPVAIILEALSVERVSFGEEVFGLGSEVALEGRMRLEGGSLSADLSLDRLDGPGGTLELALGYANETGHIDIDLTLTEPENGILANLLNVEGKPALALALTGSGPITGFAADLGLSADGRPALTGAARVGQSEAGLAISADLRGPIAGLIAAPYRPFFGAETALTAEALLREGGGLTLSGLRLSGGQLALEAAAETTPDNFLRRLDLRASIADPAGGPVTLPVPGNATRIGAGQIAVDFGAAGAESWTATVALDGLEAEGFAARTVTLDLGGVAANIEDPEARRVTLNGDGAVSGISASPEIEAALGESIGLGLAGLWEAGGPVEIAQFRILGRALDAMLTGQLDDFVFSGEIGVETDSIAPFSGLAGRGLSGGLSLSARGDIALSTGGFDLVLNGTGRGLAISEPVADRLLAGPVALSGRIARTETGLLAEGFRLGNDRLSLTAEGTYATGEADFGFSLNLSDLGLLAENASGALSVTGSARGTEGRIALSLEADAPAGTLAGRPLRQGRVSFAGLLDGDALTGNLTGSGFLGGHAVELVSAIASDAESTRLTGLRFSTAGASAQGELILRPDGLYAGDLSLSASDISTAAALALAEARGSIEARIRLMPVEDRQAAEISGRVRDLRFNDIRIGSADIAARADDLFGVPAVSGQLSGSAIAAAGVEFDRLAANADHAGEASVFSAEARLAIGTDIALAGSLAPRGEGFRLGLDRLSLVQGQLSARLARPSVLIVDGPDVLFDALRIDVGSGSITATGSAGEALDIALAVDRLPLSLANALAPELGLAGTVSGEARVTGTAADPRASFAIEGQGLDASAISGFGIAPFAVSARGGFANDTVQLDALGATGAGGLQIAGSGAVPLSGPGLAVSVTGSAPLSLANRFLADRGGQASGVARLGARVSGSLSAPQIFGTATTSGAQYVDPELNLRLLDIEAAIALEGEEARIERLSARLATGGRVSGSGTVRLAGQFPADIALALESARYADGNLFVLTASGRLTLVGNLLGNPLLSGGLLLEEANLTVPDTFGGAEALVDVRHVNAPRAVEASLERARIEPRGAAPVPATRSPGLLLDVTVDAPNQVFVRGRGLDAELGGSLRLMGRLDALQPVGGFQLLRGRLAILGQRIDFESGAVTLTGDLDPLIDLVARTRGEGITVFVTVSGRVSDIEITLSSDPVLPQDEVLARLIFNRSMGELSPLQLARLAAAAAELVGGGGGAGPLDALREAAGLADLDVVTDASGNVAVQAGAYIQDNVYLGVSAGADGQSRVTINLDVTEDLKITGAAGADGNSSLGIFFERDY